MVDVNDKKLFIGQGARLASVNRDVAVLVNAEDLVEPNTIARVNLADLCPSSVYEAHSPGK